ncbi:hypothetical protein ACET3X_006190 [Alternaria dauci]|uniref:Uncharacterized protein n=1 Tax=Alternaria dauci TaxID=48095 RepID=A0ABR3UKA1_9PLEO
MDYYYSSDNNESKAAKIDQVDGESDSDGDGDEHIRDLGIGSHNPNSWSAYNKEGKKLKIELSMHLKDKNRKEVARVQREIHDHLRRGEVDLGQLDPETIACLEAIDSPEPRRTPQHAVRLPAQPPALPSYAGLSQVLVIPTISLPPALNLARMDPPHIVDNGTWEAGSGLALNGVNQALYRKASPANLDYKTLLTFEMTVLEMATYIPLAFSWSGGFLSRVVSAGGRCTIAARMMLWARDLDNDTDSKQKIGNLRSTMQHKLSDYITSNSTDKTASSWTYTRKMPSGAMPNLIADIPLLRLRHGVTRPPRGRHRGRLTTAIEHAYTRGHWGVMLSQVEQYIQHFSLKVPASLAADADRLAIEDLKGTYRAATH